MFLLRFPRKRSHSPRVLLHTKVVNSAAVTESEISKKRYQCLLRLREIHRNFISCLFLSIFRVYLINFIISFVSHLIKIRVTMADALARVCRVFIHFMQTFSTRRMPADESKRGMIIFRVQSFHYCLIKKEEVLILSFVL